MSHKNLHKFATICKNVVWDDSMLKWCPGQQFAKQVVQNDNLQNLRKKLSTTTICKQLSRTTICKKLSEGKICKICKKWSTTTISKKDLSRRLMRSWRYLLCLVYIILGQKLGCIVQCFYQGLQPILVGMVWSISVAVSPGGGAVIN